MAVCTRHVEKVTVLVLEMVAWIKVDRLTSAIFARYIYWRLMDMHSIIGFELAGDWSDTSLHSDGRMKNDQSYSIFDGKTNVGSIYVLGLWDS